MIISLITHPFPGVRICVINHVSDPKLLSFISVTCPMDTRQAHTMSFVIIFGIFWYTLLCNPAGPGQFCALPSECLALWQCQQLNVSVHHASSVVDMPCAQVTTCQHLSCHCWKPCTISACFHGITHNPYTVTKWQWILTGATHITHTKIKTHFTLQSLPWFQENNHLQSDVLMVSTHSCTMTQSSCADYMLKYAVP